MDIYSVLEVSYMRHAIIMNKSYILMIVAGLLWGTTGTAEHFAPSGANPLLIGFFRIFFAGLFLLLADMPRNGIGIFKGPWPWKPCLGSAVGMGFYQLFFFAALPRTGVAVGTMVAMGSAPVMAGIIGYIFFSERPTTRWLIATALAIGGCCFLAIPSGNHDMNTSGIILALMAGLCWAVAGSSMKKLPPSRSPLEKAAIMLILGSVIISPVLVFGDIPLIFSMRGTAVILHLSLMATAIPYTLFAMGIGSVPLSTAYTLSLVEPLTASCLGILLLREALTMRTSIGIIMIFAGLVTLSIKRETSAQAFSKTI